MKFLLTLLLATGCATAPCEDCTGLRATIDMLERRQEENEAALGMCEREKRAAYRELDEALDQLEIGQELTEDLVVRHWGEGDDHDAQLRAVCEWIGIPVPGEE